MIDAIQALILGIVQGITEWLPISSSGHLALVQLAMNLQVPIFFDIVLHLGTLAAVIGVYRRELLSILKSIKSIHQNDSNYSEEEAKSNKWGKRYLLLIILGMIPTALMGIGFRSVFEESFYSMWSIGLGFIISGAMIFVTKFIGKGTNSIGKIDAVLIGVAQHRLVHVLLVVEARLDRGDEFVLVHLREAAEEEDIAVVLAVAIDDRRRLPDARQHRRHREQR